MRSSLIAIALICMIAVSFAGESGKGGSPSKKPSHGGHKKHKKMFEADFCVQNIYAECKAALAPHMGSMAAIANAGEAINTCLKIKQCPIMKSDSMKLYNPYFLGDSFAEDLELVGEWLLIDSQCEQDLGAEMFLASNLLVDYKNIENDIMDIIFMAMFGEQGYEQCKPLFSFL